MPLAEKNCSKVVQMKLNRWPIAERVKFLFFDSQIFNSTHKSDYIVSSKQASQRASSWIGRKNISSDISSKYHGNFVARFLKKMFSDFQILTFLSFVRSIEDWFRSRWRKSFSWNRIWPHFGLNFGSLRPHFERLDFFHDIIAWSSTTIATTTSC